MLFTSYEFLGFMIVLLVLYYVLPKKCQWPLLLVASYLFYCFADFGYLIYILVTTVTTYFVACFIEQNREKQRVYLKQHKTELSREEKKEYKTNCQRTRFRWLILCLCLNIGILAVLKYTNFLISNVNEILGAMGTRQLSFVSFVLPLGISFYTFRAMGYLIDVYRGTISAEKNIFKLALFVSFFPLLIQGPISRYGDLTETLYVEHQFCPKTVCYGLQRMLWGYFKKMVIADRILIGLNTIISDSSVYYGAYAFVGMLFYTLQLYADFTGGIDITIGIAETMGITVQENFERPYFSKSLKEYWRRWHITMGAWFRDYLFYPLSICRPMQRFTKFCRAHLGEKAGKRLPVYLSSFIVWFSTGIWHGANWSFIIWGLANWLILMISEEFEPLYNRFHERYGFSNQWGYKLFQVARTFMLVSMLKLFDCYTSVITTFKMFGSMISTNNWNILWDGSLMRIGLTTVDYGIIMMGILVLLVVGLCQRKGSVRDKIATKAYPMRFLVWFALSLMVLLFGIYGIGYDASQFIYNRF